MKTVTISQAEYQSLKQQIAVLETNEKHLLEQIQLLKKAQFGSKSERAIYLEQLSLDNLFDEAEVLSDPEQKEPALEEVIQVPAHTRKKSSVREQLPNDIPVVERHYYVDEAGKTCPNSLPTWWRLAQKPAVP